MRFFANPLRRVLLAAALLASVWTSLPAASETMSEKTLKEVVARQKDIFARAQKEGEHLDEAWLRGELQSVINSYDVLIQKSPEFAPAYVAYGQLLGQVGMTREAVGILLKANQLDPEIPLVKNQMAKHLAEDGKPVEAVPWLMAAIDLEPKEPLYHFHLGLLLNDGRDDLLKAGTFTRTALDKAMIEAFTKAAELAPDNFAYAYRRAEAFYDLEAPRWDEALATWKALESRAKPGVELQTIRLHEANVLIKRGKPDDARPLIAEVTENVLQKQKQTLLDQLDAKAEK